MANKITKMLNLCFMSFTSIKIKIKKKGCARQRRTQSRVEDRTLIGRLLFAPFRMFHTRKFSPHSARTVLLSLALIPEWGGLRKAHTAGLGLARDRRGTGHQALLTLFAGKFHSNWFPSSCLFSATGLVDSATSTAPVLWLCRTQFNIIYGKSFLIILFYQKCPLYSS